MYHLSLLPPTSWFIGLGSPKNVAKGMRMYKGCEIFGSSPASSHNLFAFRILNFHL
jgi:hypothetical protein